MISLIHVKDLTKQQINPEDYIIFGGTFDPFHRGHLSVITTLQKIFQKIIIAHTDQNPWKNEIATEINLRRKFIKLILQSEGLNLDGEKLILSEINYIYAEELVLHYRKIFQGKLYWAVGEDVAGTVKNWRNWDKLNVPTVIISIEINIHSTDIRVGTKPIHPAIAELVKKHTLYRQY